MKSLILTMVSISMLAATFVAAGLQVVPPQERTETISGRVTGGDTKAPLPQTRLELVREDYARLPTRHEKPCKPEPDIETTSARRFVTSDANGKFTFTGIVPGKYYLFAEREGFLKFAWGQRGRLPLPTVLNIGVTSEIDQFFTNPSPQTDVPMPATPPPATNTAAPPRGGLGAVQQGTQAGAPSALRGAGTIEQTGQRGGLGREAVRVTAGAASSISDGNRNLLQDLQIPMTPAPAITGIILDEKGASLAAASVQAYQFRYTPLNGRTLKTVRTALTNDEGKYRLFWLDPGRYVVAAGYTDYGLQPWAAQGLGFTPNLPNADSGLPVGFYPNASLAANALVVSLNSVTQPFTELRLRSRPRLTVRIHLTGDSIPQNASLVFVPAGGDLCTSPDYGIIREKDGTFTLRDVPEGVYVAAAMSGRDFISPLVTMKIENGGRNEATIAVAAPRQVRGNIYFDSLPDGIDLSAVRINLNRTGQELRQITTGVMDAANGRFTIQGVGPGSYYPTVELPPGLYVDNVGVSKFDINSKDDCSSDESVWSPSYEYMDAHGHLRPLLIPQTIPLAGECLAIKVKAGGPFFGAVRDRVSRPIPGALVVAIPKSMWAKSDDSGVTPPDRILTGTTDMIGFYVLRGATEYLSPGGIADQEYRLLAFENIDPSLIYDPGFSDRFRGHELFQVVEAVRNTTRETWRTIADETATTARASSCRTKELFHQRFCVVTIVPASETAEIQ